MRLPWPVLCALISAGCSGVAYNTRVAETPASRFAMAAFVVPGETTDTAMITRWGLPVQKIRRGAQTEFVYRNMRNPAGRFPLPQYGDSERYVIVTFQYGLATDVRISDQIGCRATFAPRPPNYSFDNPTQVALAGSCRTDGAETSAGSITPDAYHAGGGKSADLK